MTQTDTYNIATGPSLQSETRTARSSRTPNDLTRSRTVGLSREMCSDCLAARHNSGDLYTQHAAHCSTPGTFTRERTGPLVRGDTSTSWRKSS